MSRRHPRTLADRTFRTVLADLADLDAEIEAARRRQQDVVVLAIRLRPAS
jgi:hypothetical protein